MTTELIKAGEALLTQSAPQGLPVDRSTPRSAGSPASSEKRSGFGISWDPEFGRDYLHYFNKLYGAPKKPAVMSGDRQRSYWKANPTMHEIHTMQGGYAPGGMPIKHNLPQSVSAAVSGLAGTVGGEAYNLLGNVGKGVTWPFRQAKRLWGGDPNSGAVYNTLNAMTDVGAAARKAGWHQMWHNRRSDALYDYLRGSQPTNPVENAIHATGGLAHDFSTGVFPWVVGPKIIPVKKFPVLSQLFGPKAPLPIGLVGEYADRLGMEPTDEYSQMLENMSPNEQKAAGRATVQLIEKLQKLYPSTYGRMPPEFLQDEAQNYVLEMLRRGQLNLSSVPPTPEAVPQPTEQPTEQPAGINAADLAKLPPEMQQEIALAQAGKQKWLSPQTKQALRGLMQAKAAPAPAAAAAQSIPASAFAAMSPEIQAEISKALSGQQKYLSQAAKQALQAALGGKQ